MVPGMSQGTQPIFLILPYTPTPPLKKVQEPKNFTLLLTLISGVIYQADQELGGP